MHVTIAFSRKPLDWVKAGEAWDSEIEIAEGGARMMESFGENGEAKVLLFSSSQLSWRHEQIKEAGASWDHPEYQPHITISYDPDGPDIKDIEPYRGKIVLGPEIFQEVNEDWKSGIKET
jgi:2'-5' RNA ligase